MSIEDAWCPHAHRLHGWCSHWMCAGLGDKRTNRPPHRGYRNRRPLRFVLLYIVWRRLKVKCRCRVQIGRNLRIQTNHFFCCAYSFIDMFVFRLFGYRCWAQNVFVISATLEDQWNNIWRYVCVWWTLNWLLLCAATSTPGDSTTLPITALHRTCEQNDSKPFIFSIDSNECRIRIIRQPSRIWCIDWQHQTVNGHTFTRIVGTIPFTRPDFQIMTRPVAHAGIFATLEHRVLCRIESIPMCENCWIQGNG